jgi:hypothetical protein
MGKTCHGIHIELGGHPAGMRISCVGERNVGWRDPKGRRIGAEGRTLGNYGTRCTYGQTRIQLAIDICEGGPSLGWGSGCRSDCGLDRGSSGHQNRPRCLDNLSDIGSWSRHPCPQVAKGRGRKTGALTSREDGRRLHRHLDRFRRKPSQRRGSVRIAVNLWERTALLSVLLPPAGKARTFLGRPSGRGELMGTGRPGPVLRPGGGPQQGTFVDVASVGGLKCST